jgi:YesN/AraC family two-component response regulator
MYKFNVLVVEDELLIAWDIKKLLEDIDIDVHIAKDFTSAINSIKIYNPDLVILDVYLGKEMSGIDLGRQLSVEYNIPFIYLTSYSDSSSIKAIIETKPRGFITKPFKKIDLLTTVQVLIASENRNNSGLIKFKEKYTTDASYIIKKVLKFIDDNIESKIEVDDLVALTKWSKHHFIRIFTSQMNISPYSYVLNIKIEHAKIMMLDRSMRLEYIAYDLGFQSYVNFARTFKNYTKCSPKDYRNMNKSI